MTLGRGWMLVALLASFLALPVAATHTPILGHGTGTFPDGRIWDATLTWGNEQGNGDALFELVDPETGLGVPEHAMPARRALLEFEYIDGERPGCFLWERYTIRIEAATPRLLFDVGAAAPWLFAIEGVQEWNLCTNERHGHFEGSYLQVVALDLCQGNCLNW